MSAAVSVEQLKTVEDYLATLAGRIEDPEAITSEIAQEVAESCRMLFEDGVDPWGTDWEPLAESTKRQRRGSGARAAILRDTGALMNSVVGYGRGNEAIVGAGTGPSAAYARIHLFGGRAGRGRRAKIPARPYLPVTGGEVVLPEEWEADILDIIRTKLGDD